MFNLFLDHKSTLCWNKWQRIAIIICTPGYKKHLSNVQVNQLNLSKNKSDLHLFKHLPSYNFVFSRIIFQL